MCKPWCFYLVISLFITAVFFPPWLPTVPPCKCTALELAKDLRKVICIFLAGPYSLRLASQPPSVSLQSQWPLAPICLFSMLTLFSPVGHFENYLSAENQGKSLASFLSRIKALQYLLSSACKQFFCIFCSIFVVVFSGSVSSILVTRSWLIF